MSITGFDGIDLAWMGPTRLTTVVQDGPTKGHLIATAVQQLLDGATAQRLTLPLEVRIGDTTGPVPA